MELSSALLNILVCPLTEEPLIYDRQNQELISTSAGLAYPIIDGIPIMLVDRARKIKNNRNIQRDIDISHDAKNQKVPEVV